MSSDFDDLFVVIGKDKKANEAIAKALRKKMKEEDEHDLSCFKCENYLTEDEAIWATEDGVLTMHGDPYCDACLPEESGTHD